MPNCKWKGILAKPLSVNYTSQDLQARFDALFESYGITEDFTDDEIFRYKVLVTILAKQAKIPGFYIEPGKNVFLIETKEFIFWLEFTRLQLEKNIKSQLETASVFKQIDSNNEIIRFYQRKSEETILDNYKKIGKNNQLVKEFKESKKDIHECVIEGFKSLPFEVKLTVRYNQELRKETKRAFLEVIIHSLPFWYEHYFKVKEMFKKE